jgi:uncharacterized cupredoxin-like copper-binding protein
MTIRPTSLGQIMARRKVVTNSTVSAAVAILTLVIALSGCGSTASPGTAPTTASPIAITTSPLVPHENSTEVVTAQPPGSFQIVMTGGLFNPDRPQVAAGDASFYLVNPSTSTEQHQMTILDAHGRVLAASARVDVQTAALFTVKGMKPGSYQFYCAVDGHRAEGMTGILQVR